MDRDMTYWYKDTKKYKGCAYKRVFADETKHAFTAGQEMNLPGFIDYKTMNRTESWWLTPERKIRVKTKSCNRKVCGKDLFGRPVCKAHLEIELLETKKRAKKLASQIKQLTKGLDEVSEWMSKNGQKQT